MSTFLELQTRVRYHLRDSAGNFVLTAAIKDWINEAQLDVAARLRPVTNKATGTTSAGNTLAVPADFLALRTLRLDTDGDGTVEDDVEIVDDDVFNDSVDEGVTLDHTIARVIDGNFEFYGTPTTGTAYELVYYQKPTDLSADGDVSVLPLELHKKLGYYALYQSMMQVGEEGRADRWLALYEEGLPPLSVGLRLWPGPLSVEPEKNQFDLTTDAIHY